MQTTEYSTTPKPFVKWAGGKRSIIDEILLRIPHVFNNYYEPFVGGGALYFSIAKKIEHATLSDVNKNLITSYQAIKDQHKRLIQSLRKHAQNHNTEYYYFIRQRTPRAHIEIASRFLYLNKTCYNGLYRVNSKGIFNTPLGKYQNPNIVQDDNLFACSKILRNAELVCCDFAAIKPKRGDFVYFDPPYHSIDRTSFTSYSKDDFTENDQIRLHDFILELHKNGVAVMLSNSKTPFIQNLYSDSFFIQHTVQAPRFVNCKATARGEVNELLITNY